MNCEGDSGSTMPRNLGGVARKSATSSEQLAEVVITHEQQRGAMDTPVSRAREPSAAGAAQSE